MTAFVIGAKNGINVWLGGDQCYFNCLWVWAEEMEISNYPIAVKLCFWIASIYHAQLSYEERGADWSLVVVVMDVIVNVIAGLIGVVIGFILRRNKTKSEK